MKRGWQSNEGKISKWAANEMNETKIIHFFLNRSSESLEIQGKQWGIKSTIQRKANCLQVNENPDDIRVIFNKSQCNRTVKN